MLTCRTMSMIAIAALLPTAALRAQTATPPMGQTAPSPAPVTAPVEAPTGTFSITPTDTPPLIDTDALGLATTQLMLGKDMGDRMTMPVEIPGGGGPYDFVIDTGSQRTIIAKELAQRLALPELAPVEIVSMAGRVTVSTVRLGGLKFGDHSIAALDALSIAHSDLGSAGLIGLDGLRDKRLILDFKARQMDVSESRSVSRSRADGDTIVVRARSRFGQLILVDSRIDGRKVNVILDTGAEISVGNMALFRNLKLKKLVVPPTPTVLTSVTGIAVPAQFTIVRQLSVGTVKLNNVPMVFLDAAPFEELDLGDKPAMLLGMKMLRLFDRIAIDFGNRHVDFHIQDQAGGATPQVRVAAAESAPAAMR